MLCIVNNLDSLLSILRSVSVTYYIVMQYKEKGTNTSFYYLSYSIKRYYPVTIICLIDIQYKNDG